MRGDLHIHTDVSDGLLSPATVVERAATGGLDFFSVTDHNSLAGLGQVQKALPRGQMRFILGVELSAQPQEGREVHLLGYGVDPDCAELQEACLQVTRRKKEQIREMADRLQRGSVDIELEDIPLADDETYVGRPLLAALLVRNGVVESLNQAFGRYLGEHAPAFVRMREFSPYHCMEAIHRAGGLAVLAHPTIDTVDRWIQPLRAVGLDGVEAHRPALGGNAQLYVEKAAAYFGLFVTGGSDWHGRDGEPPLGTFSISGEQARDFFSALSSS